MSESSCVTWFCMSRLLQEHPELINDIRDDLRDEGAKFGEVKKIIIFDVRIFIVYTIHKCRTMLKCLK